jgi:hypothetical protein
LIISLSKSSTGNDTLDMHCALTWPMES